MSLINDALKRAKAAQENAPPPPGLGPQLRPVEPEETTLFVRHGLGLVFPIALAVVALLILFLVWQYAPRANAAKETPQEQTEPQFAQPAAAQPPALAIAPSVTAVIPPLQTNAVAPSVPQPPAPVAHVPAVTNSLAPSAATNLALAMATPPPKPPLPKLQGITYDPRRPSALIDGKTLFVGERVSGFRVVAIGRDTATVVGGGRTVVLSLEE